MSTLEKEKKRKIVDRYFESRPTFQELKMEKNI